MFFKLDSFVDKSAKFQLFYAFLSKKYKTLIIFPWLPRRKQSEPAFSVDIIQDTSC